jgi:hypothetical protein
MLHSYLHIVNYRYADVTLNASWFGPTRRQERPNFSPDCTPEKTIGSMYAERNIEARSCNHCTVEKYCVFHILSSTGYPVCNAQALNYIVICDPIGFALVFYNI